MHKCTWDTALAEHQTPERLGPGKDAKCTAHLGLCLCGAPESLSSLDLVSAQNRGPSWTVPSWSTQSPEWLGPGKGAKRTAHLGCSMGSTESLSSLDMGSAQNSGPSWDSALTEHPVACAVWTWEVPSTLGCGIPRVVHPLRAHPGYDSGICRVPASQQYN